MNYPFSLRKKAFALFSLSLLFAFNSFGVTANAQNNSSNAPTPQKSTHNSSTQNKTGETASKKTETSANERATRSFTATAYSLRGRTASGRRTSKGVIAADHHVLPLGTRVKLDAGNYSGEYVVADTGGRIRGSRIDIWVPDTHEARRFGRRPVKLTVLEYGAKRSRTARRK
jgi:3D (Asp-Asp-Asp) domain-containing protein